MIKIPFPPDTDINILLQFQKNKLCRAGAALFQTGKNKYNTV